MHISAYKSVVYTHKAVKNRRHLQACQLTLEATSQLHEIN